MRSLAVGARERGSERGFDVVVTLDCRLRRCRSHEIVRAPRRRVRAAIPASSPARCHAAMTSCSGSTMPRTSLSASAPNTANVRPARRVRGEPAREHARRLRIVGDVDDEFRRAGSKRCKRARHPRLAHAARDRIGVPAEPRTQCMTAPRRRPRLRVLARRIERRVAAARARVSRFANANRRFGHIRWKSRSGDAHIVRRCARPRRAGRVAVRTRRRWRDGPSAKDAGLLAADAVAVVAEPVLMIDIDRGDDGDVGIDEVYRIEASAETDFEHRDVEPRFARTAAARPACRIRNRSARYRRAPPRCARTHRPAPHRRHRRRRRVRARCSAADAARCTRPPACPPARNIASRNATVEPLPLVPPTVMTIGAGCGAPSRSQTSRTRSRPSSIARGCTRC